MANISGYSGVIPLDPLASHWCIFLNARVYDRLKLIPKHPNIPSPVKIA